MFRGRRADNRRGPTFAILLLMNELFRTANETGLPPITASFIIGQILLYLRYINVPWRDPYDVCISLDRVYWRGDWRRFFFSAFEHADDMHLYYNMISFLSKGKDLERRFGSKYFLYLLTCFTALTNATYILLSYLLTEIMDDHKYSYQCAVGFSGVIFALKVLTTHYWPSRDSYYMGIPIGSKYVVWAELILIQMLNPGVSFIGHLSGILVGIAYVFGPLRSIMDGLINVSSLNWLSSFSSSYFGPSSSVHGSYTNYVPHGISEEEQFRLAREASLRENFPSHDNSYSRYTTNPSPSAPYFEGDQWTSQTDTNGLSPEEVRRRRLEYLNNLRR